MEEASEETFVDYATIALEHHALSICTDKIVPRKTVVYETLVDPTVIKVTGERLKRRLFTKFLVLRPKPALVQLVSMTKYYEPYIVINARYFLDYYRMCDYSVYVDNEVREVILLNQKFYPEKHPNAVSSITLQGEERLVVENKAFFMLAKDGKEANLETLPSAPSEKNPEETITKYCIAEVDSTADINFVRKKLVQRPENLSRIVDEVFEVGERVVIYAPRFKLQYIHTQTGQEKSIEFDGVTAKRINVEGIFSILIRAIKSVPKAIIEKQGKTH